MAVRISLAREDCTTMTFDRDYLDLRWAVRNDATCFGRIHRGLVGCGDRGGALIPF
jgi:hypothetical protein